MTVLMVTDDLHRGSLIWDSGNDHVEMAIELARS